MSRLRPIISTVILLAGLVLAGNAGVAWASWTAPSISGGAGAAAATTVESGNAPTVVANSSAVTLSWAPSTLSSGDPVAGYLIGRYDADTLASQTVAAGCAGLITATTCTESDLPDGQWVYTLTPTIGTNWTGPASPASAPVTTDSTSPANTITTTVLTGNAAQNGATIFYQGTAAGSFTLTNTVADAGSGAASSTTTALTGDTTGWTHTPSTVTSPPGGPYVSSPFSWSAATTATPSEVVLGRDAAGNVATTSLTFVNDSTPPTAGTIDYLNGYQPDQSVTVSFTAGTDSGSGIATRQLQRADAVLTDGICGTFAAFTDIGADTPTSPYLDTQVSDGHCYTYRYIVTDRVGNQDIATSASVAQVDAADGGPRLGAAGPYSVLAGTGVVNTLTTTISGDLGVSPSTSITGFPPGTVAGTVHAGDPAAAAAQSSLVLAYNDAAARTPSIEFAGDQNGKTFHAGNYHSAAAFALTGTLTLDAQGDPNAVFIIQVDAALTTAAASTVALINGAQASHVFWQVVGAATLGANSSFAGTIMAAGTITIGDGTHLIGRALSHGTITLANNTITTN